MRVLLFPADGSGCGFYRMREPARAVAEAFPDIDVQVTDQIVGYIDRDTRELDHLDVDGADVVVLQRTVSVDWVRQLKKQGVAVVIELDDLLSGLPVEHVGYRAYATTDMAARVEQCAREADYVTVSTPALLAAYARHGRGAVIPNAIPRALAELPPAYERTPDPVTVGWTGIVSSHPLDLPVIGWGLRQALNEAGERARFLTWGERGVREQLGVAPQVTSWRPDPEAFVADVGEQLDVGLAPLHDSRFNRAKSWLKPLEYAARGVLPIYSPTIEYARLRLGVPAARPGDWAKHVARAISDGDWRRQVAERARLQVLDRHLTEHTAERWAAAWWAAADQRARTRAA